MAERDLNALLRFKQIQELIPVCKVTWYKMVNNGIVPSPKKIGRASFWRYRDIVDFINKEDAAIYTAKTIKNQKEIKNHCNTEWATTKEISKAIRVPIPKLKYWLKVGKFEYKKENNTLFFEKKHIPVLLKIKSYIKSGMLQNAAVLEVLNGR